MGKCVRSYCAPDRGRKKYSSPFAIRKNCGIPGLAVEDLGKDSARRHSRPWSIWIHRSANHLDDFPHAATRKHSSFWLKQGVLLQYLNEMCFQV